MVYKIDVLGQRWKVFLHEEDYYVDVYNDSDGGHTSPEIREIHLNGGEVSVMVIVHELVHAFYSSLCMNDATLTKDQQEEIFCEMFAIHGQKMLTLAKKLYKEMCTHD